MTSSAAGNAKIAIFGAGHVGVTLAYACMIRGTGKTIALYDRNAEKVQAEALDLQHGLQFVPIPSVVNRTGVLKVLPVPLSEDERADLQHSARAVRAVIDQLEL